MKCKQRKEEEEEEEEEEGGKKRRGLGGGSVYQVDGYTILHSGRPVPDESKLMNNEGFAIVLSTPLTTEIQ